MMPTTVNLSTACRQASEAEDPSQVERIIHAALVAGGVPARRVAALKDPLDFDGPADYLKHICKSLAPDYIITYPIPKGATP